MFSLWRTLLNGIDINCHIIHLHKIRQFMYSICSYLWLTLEQHFKNLTHAHAAVSCLLQISERKRRHAIICAEELTNHSKSFEGQNLHSAI